MFGLLHRKLLRELAASGMTVLAIVLVTMVGIACFVAMQSAHRNLSWARGYYYSRGRMADFWISVKKLPREELFRLKNIPGIVEIQPRIRFPVTVDLPDQNKPLAGVALSLPDVLRPTLNQIEILRGGYFTGTRPNEVIVNDVFAQAHGLRVGQKITLNLGRRREDLTIVGTAFSCEFVYPLGPAAIVPDREGFGIFYLKESFAQDVYDMAGAANELVGRLKPSGQETVRTILAEVERRIEEYGVISTIPLDEYPSNTFLSQEIEGLRTFAFIIPAVFLVVAAIIVNIVMIRRIEQQRIIIGTLKALGMDDRVIGWHVLEYALVVGALGGVLGCGLGQWLAGAMTQLYRRFYEFPALPSRWYPDLHVEAVALAILAAGAGGWQGMRRSLALEPASAMRPAAPPLGGSVFLERFRLLWGALTPAWRMVVRYLFRHPFRTVAGLLTGILATAVMSMILSLSVGIDYLMIFHFEWVYRSDATLVLKGEQNDSVLEEVRRLPAVRWVEPILAVPVTLRYRAREKLTTITGLRQDRLLTAPRDRVGHAIAIPPVGFVISRQLAKELGLAAGDDVEWRPVKGRREWYCSPIAAVANDYVGTAVYANIAYLDRILGEECPVNRVQLSLDENPQQRTRFFQELKRLAGIEEVLNHADMKGNLEKTLLRNIWVILSIEIGFAGTLFFGALLSAGVIAVEERRREFAALYVTGYTPLQIGGLLAREHLFILLIGLIMGLPLGYVLSDYVVGTYQSEVLRMPLLFPPRVWLLTAFWGTVFAAASHLVVETMIWRTAWLEAIKANE
ncbi:ABC transporter permease [Thermogutta sp.]|uniref:ABC transporter permease n=1 Tax=Thermogutta sp. TaxID=1962930 RepID=UPI003C7A69A6